MIIDCTFCSKIQKYKIINKYTSKYENYFQITDYQQITHFSTQKIHTQIALILSSDFSTKRTFILIFDE